MSRVQIWYRDYTRCEYDLNRMVSFLDEISSTYIVAAGGLQDVFTGPSYASASNLVTSISDITAAVDPSDFSTTQTNRNHKYGQPRS